MSAIEAPLGHAGVVAGLWRARRLGRLPHALLFEGPAGIGKFRAARYFVQGLFCERAQDEVLEERGPCGECGPCKRFAAGSHPDFHLVDPHELGEEQIPVAAIAEREGGSDSVCGFFALRAMEGGLRVVVIREFERAGVPAQNAMLKTLEEPGPGALLILESSRPDLLLETIRSRCVTVRFAPLEAREAATVLERSGARFEDAGALASWAAGSPGQALRLAEQGAPEVRGILHEVLAGELDPLQATARVLEGGARAAHRQVRAGQGGEAFDAQPLQVAAEAEQHVAFAHRRAFAHRHLDQGAGLFRCHGGDVARQADADDGRRWNRRGQRAEHRPEAGDRARTEEQEGLHRVLSPRSWISWPRNPSTRASSSRAWSSSSSTASSCPSRAACSNAKASFARRSAPRLREDPLRVCAVVRQRSVSAVPTESASWPTRSRQLSRNSSTMPVAMSGSSEQPELFQAPGHPPAANLLCPVPMSASPTRFRVPVGYRNAGAAGLRKGARVVGHPDTTGGWTPTPRAAAPRHPSGSAGGP